FFIYTMPAGHPVTDIALRRNVPVVTVDSPVLDEHPFIGTDERAAGRAVVEHMLEIGKRRIAVITYKIGDVKYGDISAADIEAGVYHNAVERLRGILGAVDEAGLPRSDVRIVVRHNVPKGGRLAT